MTPGGLLESGAEDRINDVLAQVGSRTFDQTNVFQSVLNVDSGQTETVEVNKGSISFYVHFLKKR